MSLVTLGRADFLRFCPCLYYNAVSGHVKQGWPSQPCQVQIASLNGHLCHIWRPACDLNGGQPRTH